MDSSFLRGLLILQNQSLRRNLTVRPSIRMSLLILRRSSDRIREPSDLKLSHSQVDNFGGWKRPHEQFVSQDDNVDLMLHTKDIDLVQDITTDCSVVASLCAGIARANKGHGKVYFAPSFNTTRLIVTASRVSNLSLRQKYSKTTYFPQWKIHLSFAFQWLLS